MSAVLETRQEITSRDLEKIKELYERGQYRQAYQASEVFGPLGSWRGTAARIMAGRLASHLGAMRLGAWHYVKAWRGDPADPEACWYFAWNLLERWGPLSAWN